MQSTNWQKRCLDKIGELFDLELIGEFRNEMRELIKEAVEIISQYPNLNV